jgi:hypothetical protein
MDNSCMLQLQRIDLASHLRSRLVLHCIVACALKHTQTKQMLSSGGLTLDAGIVDTGALESIASRLPCSLAGDDLQDPFGPWNLELVSIRSTH